MWPGFPSPFGSATNLDDCHRNTRRFAIGETGHSVEVAADVVPIQALPRLVTGDPLEASRTGKPGGPAMMTMDPPYVAQALSGITPQGRGIVADGTVARVKEQGIRVKLAAKGYVDPIAIARRRGVDGTDVVGHNLQFIP